MLNGFPQQCAPCLAPRIVLGESFSLTLRFRTPDLDVYTLDDSVTEITARFLNDDLSTLALTMTDDNVAISSPEQGEVIVTVGKDDCALLRAGLQNVEVWIDRGADRRIVQFKNSIDLISPLT